MSVWLGVVGMSCMNKLNSVGEKRSLWNSVCKVWCSGGLAVVNCVTLST